MGSSDNLQKEILHQRNCNSNNNIKQMNKMKYKNDKWMSIVLWFAYAYFLFQIIMGLWHI